MYELKSEEKPREKLIASGAAHLTDKELISVLLGSGIRGRKIDLLALDVLKILDSVNYQVDVKHFLTIPGLGTAKVSLLAAVFELARRLFCNNKTILRTPPDAVRLLSHFADRKQEYFICISLNGAYEVINKRIVSIGLLNRTVVHPREVFVGAIMERAAAIVCAHNHPSGNILPSREDREVTGKLVSAGKVIGIQVLDHIIFAADRYFSFQEHGELP